VQELKYFNLRFFNWIRLSKLDPKSAESIDLVAELSAEGSKADQVQVLRPDKQSKQTSWLKLFYYFSYA